MPWHFCSDELLMLLAAIPFVGMLFRRLHAWWHKHFNHHCHKEGCPETHVEHCSIPDYLADIPHGKVNEGQCKDHPLKEPTIWELNGFDSEEAWEKHITESPNT